MSIRRGGIMLRYLSTEKAEKRRAMDACVYANPTAFIRALVALILERVPEKIRNPDASIGSWI
jgi:hypothetical protein